MRSEYDNEKTGVLFKSKERRSEKSPDYHGECVLAGKKWRLAGWIRKAKKSGEPYVSLIISEPREGTRGESAPRQQEVLHDDIPF